MAARRCSRARSARTHWIAMAAAALVCLGSATPAGAQAPAEGDWPRIALVLDASGSMWAKLEGRTRIEVARSAIRELVAGWDARAELGLMAYGHRTRRDCSDIETLLPVGPADPDALIDAVDGIRPVGMTPLSASLEHAAALLDHRRRPATVILVSDGNETCGRDPCAVARALAESGVDFTTHVVGFHVGDEEKAQLQCIADATGGLFIDAQGASGLAAALRSAFDDIARRSQVPPLWLAASLSPGSAPLVEPVDWRIRPLDARGEPGEPVVEARVPTLSRRLPAGRYRIEASVDDATAALDLDVDPAVRDARVLSLDAAVVHVAAVDRMEQPVEEDVSWRVEGPGDATDTVVEREASATRFLLSSGRYRISSFHDGDTVTRTLVVRPGQILRKRFQFGIGRLALRTVLSEGRQPIQEPVHWTVRDDDGRVVRDEVAASVLYTLDTGDYTVEVAHGRARAGSDVRVRSGVTVIETLDLGAGVVGIFGALPAPGGPISEPVTWLLRGPGDVEYRSVAAAPEWVLPTGAYHVVGRHGDWRGEIDLVVRPGAERVWPVTFESGAAPAASPDAD